MSKMKRETDYKRIQSLGGWLNTFYYGAPAVVLLAGMYILGVGTEWWTPVLVVYAILAIGSSIGHGFQAVNQQMITISDYWENKLQENESQ